MHIIAKHMILVMGWAVVSAQFVTCAIVLIFIPELFSPAVKIAPIVAAIVAAPAGYIYYRQSSKLTEINLQLKEANEALERESKLARHEASLDQMTRVLNRTHFVHAVERRRRMQNAQGGYLLMLDADHFKKINDTFGHDVGDSALMTITKAIRKILRESDIVGRLGGEEFGIYLNHMTKSRAYEIAERIRKSVAETLIDVGGDEPYCITVSIGVVSAQKDQSVSEIMKLADNNLYLAKDAGRNCLVFDSKTYKCNAELPAKAAVNA